MNAFRGPDQAGFCEVEDGPQVPSPFSTGVPLRVIRECASDADS